MDPDETVEKGERLYREQIRARVEPEHRGKFVVIDVDSGDYELDENDALAAVRLVARRPHATLYGVRVGYRAAYHLGSRFGESP